MDDQLVVRVHRELREKIGDEATRQGRKISDVVRDALHHAFDDDTETPEE